MVSPTLFVLCKHILYGHLLFTQITNPLTVVHSSWFSHCDFLSHNFMCYVIEVMDSSRGVSELLRVEDDLFSLSAKH